MTPEQRNEVVRIRAKAERQTWGLVVFVWVIVFAALTCGTGCRPRIATVASVVTDSTTTSVEVTHRDTVFVIEGDSAHIAIDTSVASLQRLLSELKKESRVIRGSRNASVVLSNENGQLGITANCDSVIAILENAITVMKTERDRLRSEEKTVVVQADSEKGTMPGWMKGTIWLIVAVVLGAAVLLYLFKSVFKLF